MNLYYKQNVKKLQCLCYIKHIHVLATEVSMPTSYIWLSCLLTASYLLRRFQYFIWEINSGGVLQVASYPI